jgi:hypothetical protein
MSINHSRVENGKLYRIDYPTAIIRAKKNDQVVAIPPSK